jgi:hypothetical protein
VAEVEEVVLQLEPPEVQVEVAVRLAHIQEDQQLNLLNQEIQELMDSVMQEDKV